MNQTDRFERDLTAWFEDTAVPRIPDYVDDILERTAHVRQRPRWSFPERWLPGSVTTLRRLAPRPLPWRTIALLTALALLLVAVAAYVGSRRPLPPPFGRAENGLVAYSNGDDIFTVDPVTGLRRAIVTGPQTDHDPRWSLDGTRVAFLREVPGGEVLVVTDADGRHEVVANTPVVNADTDSIAWSPDGRSVAIGGDIGPERVLTIVNVADGVVTVLPVAYRELQVAWRPGGREIMFFGGAGVDLGLFLAAVDDAVGGVRPIVLSKGDEGIRPVGWTPDGRRFAFHRERAESDNYWTYLVDVETAEEVGYPVAFSHLSNDGTRIAGFNGVDDRHWVCVIRIDGGPCVRVGKEADAPDPSHHNGLQWTPDDQWLIAYPQSGDHPILIDPDGDSLAQPAWPADGADSMQRVAP